MDDIGTQICSDGWMMRWIDGMISWVMMPSGTLTLYMLNTLEEMSKYISIFIILQYRESTDIWNHSACERTHFSYIIDAIAAYDIIKWKYFPCNWCFVRGIHQLPVSSPDKGQWGEALMFYLIATWTNGRANHRDVGDLRCHGLHYDFNVMVSVGMIFI